MYLKQLKKWEYSYLLGSFMLLMVVEPLLSPLVEVSFLFEIPIMLVTFSGVIAVTKNKIQEAIMIVLAVLMFFFGILALSSLNSWPGFLSYLIGMSLFSYFTYHVVTGVITTDEPVDANLIIRAICGYFLIGVSFSFFYEILVWVDPNAISSANWGPGDDPRDLLEPVYFSFVTLTTLGFGDIVPVSRFAKNIVSLEAIIGQMYLTILIARLVGLHIAQKDQAKKAPLLDEKV